MKRIDCKKLLLGAWVRCTAFFTLFVVLLAVVGLAASEQTTPSLTCHDLLLFALFGLLYGASFAVGDLLFMLLDSRIPGQIARFVLTAASFYFVFCRGSLFITAVGSDAPINNRISKISALAIAFVVVYAIGCGISAIVLAVRRKKIRDAKAYEPVYTEKTPKKGKKN